MGLKFDEIIYSKITEDFGGHPFLIRQVCSAIHSLCPIDRPVVIDKALYERAKGKFLLDSKHYLEMIIQVLREWYPDEYDMLVLLANGDIDTFNGFSQDSNYYTNHLVGYGLLHGSQNGYTFNIECVKDYLTARHKYDRTHLSPEQQVAEISERRNNLERTLRQIIRNQLKATFGRKSASQKVLGALPENRRNVLAETDIDQLLSTSNSPLYFLDLINITSREWELFRNIFELDKDKVLLMLREINELRKDAHGNFPSQDDFTQIRLHFKKLESILSDWV